MSGLHRKIDKISLYNAEVRIAVREGRITPEQGVELILDRENLFRDAIKQVVEEAKAAGEIKPAPTPEDDIDGLKLT